jgi:hypothetical protein
MNWNWDYQGFGELLCGPEMEALMRDRIEKCANAARAIAPEESGRYRESFEVESGVEETLTGRRAYGRVTNTAPYAAAVEWGNRRSPAQHVLLRAVDHMQE